MKRFVLAILVIFFIIASSCNQNDDMAQIPAIPEITDLSTTIPSEDKATFSFNIYTLDKSINRIAFKSLEDLIIEANAKWNELLSSKYGIEINNIDIYTKHSGWIEEISAANIPTLQKMGYDNGLFVVSFEEFSDFLKTYEIKRKFISLDSVYENNPDLEKLSEEYTQMTKDKDGVIWGFAYEYDNNRMPGRYYSTKLLDTIRGEVPKTTDEFYELCSVLMHANEEIPVITTNKRSSNTMYGFGDILGAFGIYSGNIFHPFQSIQYNNETDSFEDFLLSDDLRSALEYIRALIDIGAAQISFTRDDFSEMDGGRLLSTYTSGMDPKRFEGNSFMPYLINDGYETMYKYNKADKVALFAKNTLNPEKIIQVMTNLTSSGSSYMELRYGESYDSQTIEGTTYISFKHGKAPFPMAIGVYDNWDFVQCGQLTSSDDLQSYVLRMRAIKEAEEYARDVFQPFNFYDHIAVVSFNIMSQHEYMWTPRACDIVCRDNLFDLSIPLDELYDEYFSEIKRMGGSQYMEYINEKTNKIWQNKYD